VIQRRIASAGATGGRTRAHTASTFAIPGRSDARREFALDDGPRRGAPACPRRSTTPRGAGGEFIGRGLRPSPVDSPEKVARAPGPCGAAPRGEIVVRAPTGGRSTTHAAPRLVGRLLAFAFEREQFAPAPAAIGVGNLLHPLPGGATAHGGWRKESRARDEFGRLQPGH